MHARGIRVSPGLAQSARKELEQAGVLDRSLRIRREEGAVIIPVTSYPEGSYLSGRCTADFEAAGGPPKFRDAARIPDALKGLLPTSFDTIGSKALMKLPSELAAYRKQIGEAILLSHRSLDGVFQDEGVFGHYRTRRLIPMAGSTATETEVREYGVRLRLDVSKTFYSPRLASERRLVCSGIRAGERVLDMFAGVGPFSIQAALGHETVTVLAVDINPYAVSYLRENAAANGARNVESHLMDAAEVCGRRFDRIIMNLPAGGREFVEHALSLLEGDGTIDYYELMENAALEARCSELAAGGAGVVSLRKVKSYSPSQGIYHLALRKIPS